MQRANGNRPGVCHQARDLRRLETLRRRRRDARAHPRGQRCRHILRRHRQRRVARTRMAVARRVPRHRDGRNGRHGLARLAVGRGRRDGDRDGDARRHSRRPRLDGRRHLGFAERHALVHRDRRRDGRRLIRRRLLRLRRRRRRQRRPQLGDGPPHHQGRHCGLPRGRHRFRRPRHLHLHRDREHRRQRHPRRLSEQGDPRHRRRRPRPHHRGRRHRQGARRGEGLRRGGASRGLLVQERQEQRQGPRRWR